MKLSLPLGDYSAKENKWFADMLFIGQRYCLPSVIMQYYKTLLS